MFQIGRPAATGARARAARVQTLVLWPSFYWQFLLVGAQVPLMFPDEFERQGGLVAVEQTAATAAVEDGKHSHRN